MVVASVEPRNIQISVCFCFMKGEKKKQCDELLLPVYIRKRQLEVKALRIYFLFAIQINPLNIRIYLFGENITIDPQFVTML